MTYKETIDPILEKWTNPATQYYVPQIVAGVITRDDGVVYQGAAGVNSIDDPSKKTNEDTIFALFSTTKALTTTAVVQLIENGKITSIDDLVEKYVPEIKDSKVLKEFSDDGSHVFEDVVEKPTIRNLLTHTAGFSYHFFNETTSKFAAKEDKYYPFRGTWKDIVSPLAFQPNTAWHYGTNIDWLGKVAENVTGLTLNDYLKANVFDKVGAESLSFIRKDHSNGALIHDRNQDGSLKVSDLQLEPNPEFHCGGHGVFGKVKDYLKFLEIFLHNGKSPQTGEVVLKPESIEKYSFGNLLPEGVNVGPTLLYAEPQYSLEVAALGLLPPGTNYWTAHFHRVNVELPTGRSAGSLYWCGLANLYYWIDPVKGIAAYWATQVYPFQDPGALGANAEFEAAVYKVFNK